MPEVNFQLYPSQQFVPCMAANPYVTPTVDVVVKRGSRNDTMKVTLKGFKPGLQFDLFSLENSLLLADSSFDPNFKGFGLVWYQSDLQPGNTTVKTILLDQTFGFDSAVGLEPTKTFHLGFLAFITRPVLPAGLGRYVPNPIPLQSRQPVILS